MKLELANFIFSVITTLILVRCKSSVAGAWCNRSCGDQKLPFPFGFSSGCQIQLNCTSNGTILAADFAVQRVVNETFLVSVPAVCGRPVEALRRLFTGNFAPTSHNAILLRDCVKQSSGCFIPMRMVQNRFQLLDCDDKNDNISCYSEPDNWTAFIDYKNLTEGGCRSLFSAISMESFGNSSSVVSLEVQIVRMGWWLRGECRCSKHATCVPISPPLERDSPAYRCKCFEGFAGDGFLEGMGCRKESVHTSKNNKVLVPLFILLGTGILIFVVTIAVIMIRYHRKKKPPRTTAAADIFATGRPARISYYELLQATDGYGENNLLGKGSFGSVYKGILRDGTTVAVKVIDMHAEGALKTFDAECEVLRNVRHRNLTKVISSCSNQKFRSIVLEYMPNGSLEKWLHSDNYLLDMMQRFNIMMDVGSALEYLHHGYSTPVIHCDLKPGNILLDEKMVGHVSDFGMTRFLVEEVSITHTRTLATLGYMAPEYGSEGVVSTRCDVYSYGIVLLETFTRRRPSDEMFGGEMSIKKWMQDSLANNALRQVIDADLISQEEENLSEKYSCLSFVLELGLSCLADSPGERMNMKDVLAQLNKIKSQFTLAFPHNEMAISKQEDMIT